MINLLLLLFFLTCIGVTASWLAENPGNVVIHWFGYRIDTSLALILLLAIVAAVVIAYTYLFLRHVVLVPERITKRRTLKQYQKGLSELTYSVAALAAADIKTAAEHTKNAEKLLGPTPLTLLLNAQIARSVGDDAKTRDLLDQMLDHKETEYLAARSLSETAGKQHMFPKALALAKRAHTINPKGIALLLSLHVRLGEWQQAMQAIDKSVRKGKLSRTQLRHYRAIVTLKQGLQLLAGENTLAALASAKHTLKFEPHFIPVVAFAAQAYAANGHDAKAIKLITHEWKIQPHEQLSAALRAVIAKQPKEKQMKIIRKLVATNPASNESDIALAQTAMAVRDWPTARAALTAALAKQETVRTCKLLAELEQYEFPGFDIGSKWIARSASALPDPAWLCNSCGKAALQWDAHCPACETFDSLEWKQRDINYVG